jgi:hypothetical protein
MRTQKVRTGLALVAVGLVLWVAGCSFSTANIKSAKLASDREGTQETTVFAPDQVIYCLVQLANAPDDTKVKADWIAVEAQGAEPNTKIADAEKTSSDGLIIFDLSNTQPWPTGKYKVDLYLNDKLNRTLEFQVQ